MSEPREAWSDVGRQFEELGRTLREHFAARTEREPGGAADGPAEGRAQVQDAVRRLRDAAQRLGDQAGDAVRDPAVRETAQRATRSLADALEATFGQLGEQLRARSGAATGPDAAPAADDAGSGQPQSLPGPHPDPAPGDDPVGGSPTRPPADS